MKSNRLGYVALSAFSAFFLVGCPTPVDMHDPDNNGGSSGNRSGGSTGSGTGGTSNNTGTGGSSNSGTGGSSSSGGMGGRAGSGGSSGGMGGRGGSTGMGGSMARGGAGGAAMDAGGGGMDASMAVGTKLPPAIAAIFTMRCPMCHNNQYRDPAMAYTRLKGNAMCGNMPRMVVGNGAMSLVVQKMKGAVAGCGMRMPLNGAAMPAAEIMMVEQWITDGAKPVP